MSKEKQIEEMARIIDDNHGFIVSSLETAKELYNAGYRKQSEVAREVLEEAEKIFMSTCLSLESYTAWKNFKEKYTEGEK